MKMPSDKETRKKYTRASRGVVLDAIKRRATVVPSAKAYKRKPKHAKKGLD